jgi:putative ABC transport system permease protein
MNEWLKNYQYRIDVSFWLLGIAGLAVLLLAMAIVGINTFKAALANPVKSLRTE